MSTGQPNPNHAEAGDDTASATNPHPSDYLNARIAALREGESSTNPHPEEYITARLASLEKAKPQARSHAPNPVRSVAAAGVSGSAPASHDPVASTSPACREPLACPVSLQDLPLDALSLDVRAILSTPHILLRPSPGDAAITPLPFQLPPSPGQVLCVTQSSKEAWFSLAWGEVSCNLYYDPSSDGLVLKNVGTVSIYAAPILIGNKLDNRKRHGLGPRATVVISPGPWRISSSKEEATEAWTDILLFRRRYVAEKGALPVAKAGLKRKDSPLLAVAPKRVRNDAGEGDRSVVLLANPSKDLGERAVATTGHPLVDLRPGETVTITSLVEHGSRTEMKGEALRSEPHSSENYSLTHLRDICIRIGSTSVFRANHPVFGHTAVKVIRSLKDPPAVSIPRIAQMWQNEERLMREVKHPSIIEMFGSDARLYSIYMEYLPYPDLTAWRNRPTNHFFSGTADDAKRVLGDMASALTYLEAKGIIHNDIKPSNILYDQSRGAILIDFGLASMPTDSLCLGGTPWYLAPEFLEHGSRAFGSDVFALGVTLLYLLGKTPLPDVTERTWNIASVFKDESEEELMRTWLAKVRDMREQLAPAGIESVVRGMLPRELGERMPAQEIVQKLK